MKKIFYILSTLTLTMGLMTSCEPDAISEEDALNTTTDIQPTMSIQEFKDSFMTEKGVIFPVRTRSTTKGLFSIDTIAPHQLMPIYIVGRVVSDDYTGNMYKTMVIQDCKHPEQGLKIAVDGSNLSGLFPVGQKIAIRVNDLYIGKYAMDPQLCVPAYNDNIYAYKAGEKVGWAPGRIPLNIFMNHVTLLGKPEPDKVVIDTMTIAEIKTNGNTPNWKQVAALSGRLVRINQVHFNGKSGGSDALDFGDPATESKVSAVFASTTMGIGYTQSRDIVDATNKYICVATSEYAKYAYYVLPGFYEAWGTKNIKDTVQYTGDIIGTLAYYYDNGNYAADGSEWSIYPRYFPGLSPNKKTDFINFINKYGELWDPQEYK